MPTLLRAVCSGFLLLFTLQASAQCISGDCTNGTGIYLFSNGTKYIGQFVESKPEGIGTCYFTDGSKYQGEWKANFPEGRGIKIYADGTKWTGTWKRGKQLEEERPDALVAEKPEEESVANIPPAEPKQQQGCISGNCRNGRGIYIYPSGTIYIGDFKDGEIDGIGVCHYSDGSKYQGQWSYRYPEGRGTKTFANGKKWTGNWKKGKPVDEAGEVIADLGVGVDAAQQSFNIQSGCLEGNCVDGSGIFAYPDGSKYDGQFDKNKPNGWGTFFYPDKSRYVGTFKSGQPNGKGTLYQNDGNKLSGEWAMGEFRGSNLIETGRTGCLEGDCKNGKGTYIFKDGSAKYVGAFRSGLPDGNGVVFYANGERYLGGWEAGSFHGPGTLIRADGTEVKGIWDAGAFMGTEEEPLAAVDPSDEETSAGTVEDNEPDEEKARLPKTINVWAVVIGVAAYDHMPTLRYTDDDAYRFYAFLKSPEGGALPDSQIRILIDEDATMENVESTMEEVFAKAGENDLVMLYFSGHGVEGAFLPIDFDGYNNRLEHSKIKAMLDSSPAKYKLFIADACHSGSLFSMRGVENDIKDYYDALANATPGTALIMSSKSDETSLESSGLRQGVFSHFLIRGLKGEADSNKDDVVTIRELFVYINKSVKTYTGNRQSPVIEGDYDEQMTVSIIK